MFWHKKVAAHFWTLLIIISFYNTGSHPIFPTYPHQRSSIFTQLPLIFIELSLPSLLLSPHLLNPSFLLTDSNLQCSTSFPLEPIGNTIIPFLVCLVLLVSFHYCCCCKTSCSQEKVVSVSSFRKDSYLPFWGKVLDL